MRDLARMRRGLLVLSLVGVVVATPAWAGGWYLLSRPLLVLKGETTPPVRRWHHIQAFDSASDCERARREVHASWAALEVIMDIEVLRGRPRDAFPDHLALSNATLAWINAADASKIPAELRRPIMAAVQKLQGEFLCIASDDGRLK